MFVNIQNKKAYYDFFVEDEIEVGIELQGKEAKAIRQGKVNLKGSWCNIENGEMFVYNMHISNYQDSNRDSLLTKSDPYRKRKLLLHRKEIRKLFQLKQLEGVTFVPLRLYEVNGWMKMSIGICSGKKRKDKREIIKKRDLDREARRFKD